MKTFKEITTDNGIPMRCAASNNDATYVLTSSWAKDARKTFVDRYNRLPSSSWYNRHFIFEEVANS